MLLSSSLENMSDEDSSMTELDMQLSSLVVRTKLSGGDCSGDTGRMPAAISLELVPKWH